MITVTTKWEHGDADQDVTETCLFETEKEVHRYLEFLKEVGGASSTCFRGSIREPKEVEAITKKHGFVVPSDIIFHDHHASFEDVKVDGMDVVWEDLLLNNETSLPEDTTKLHMGDITGVDKVNDYEFMTLGKCLETLDIDGNSSYKTWPSIDVELVEVIEGDTCKWSTYYFLVYKITDKRLPDGGFLPSSIQGYLPPDKIDSKTEQPKQYRYKSKKSP